MNIHNAIISFVYDDVINEMQRRSIENLVPQQQQPGYMLLHDDRVTQVRMSESMLARF